MNHLLSRDEVRNGAIRATLLFTLTIGIFHVIRVAARLVNQDITWITVAIAASAGLCTVIGGIALYCYERKHFNFFRAVIYPLITAHAIIGVVYTIQAATFDAGVVAWICGLVFFISLVSIYILSSGQVYLKQKQLALDPADSYSRIINEQWTPEEVSALRATLEQKEC